MSKEEDETAVMNHDVLYPALTDDYRLSKTKVGLGLVANRKIKKGRQVMMDSFEFMFSDIQEGDRLWLDRSDEASKQGGGIDLPTHMPLTREMLLRTHGVPVLQPQLSSTDEVVVRWQLETPGMLINHSCDPSITVDSHDVAKGEDYASTDLQEGDEITVDYVQQYYDRGPFFEECLCGAEKCRGKMMGFKDLSDAEKEMLLPKVSPAVRAMHLAEVGKGPKVREVLPSTPPRVHMPTSNSKSTMRIVFPGPSAGLANVIVKQDEKDSEKFALFAANDVAKGAMFYEFWWQEWPHGGEAVIDMEFSCQLLEGDPKEGTLIRFDPTKVGAYRTAENDLMFSGWELLTSHSCDPNVVYRNKESYEEDDWQSAFAAKDIKKGDRITMDYNCMAWDRSDSGDTECLCGSSSCVGAKLGFKHLSPETQNGLMTMTWLRETKAEEDSEALGTALSPHIRAMLKKVGFSTETCVNDEPSTCSSSSDSGEDAN